MRTLFLSADQLLRGTGPFGSGATAARPPPVWLLPAIILAFTPIYGAAMGSYAGAEPPRPLQMLYSAVKVPLLLGATTLLCLPGFIVLTTILGLRDDLRRALSAILSAQAAMAIALAALSPLTVVFYFSSAGYADAQVFNGVMFFVATLAAQLVMRRGYRPLIAQNPRHRVVLAVWLALYIFTGIQMGWTLRPFIGLPSAATTFFRDEPFSNAYVVLAKILAGLFR